MQHSRRIRKTFNRFCTKIDRTNIQDMHEDVFKEETSAENL